jgi:hypothetical protein
MKQNTRIWKWCLVLMAWGMPGLPARAQSPEWPVHYTRPYANLAPVYDGIIFLENGDSVKGRIKMIPFTQAYPILPEGKNLVEEISRQEIRKVRIFYSMGDRPFGDFVNLHRGIILWRLVAGKGVVGIYDNGTGNSYGTRMFVVDGPNGQKGKKIYGQWSYIFHNGAIRRLLFRFARKRYDHRIQRKDFPTDESLFQFILMKEAGSREPAS